MGLWLKGVVFFVSMFFLLTSIIVFGSNSNVKIDEGVLKTAEAHPNETISVILVFDKKPEGYRQIIESLRGRIIYDYSIIEGLSIEIPAQALNGLQKMKNLKRIHENRKMKAFLSDSIPQINADDVWALGYDGTGSTVCIVDTGVDYDHPALAGKVIAQHCYCCSLYNPWGKCVKSCCPGGGAEGNDAMDDNGHGTHVAGIVASTNDTYKGVAPGASIYAVKVLDEDGVGYENDVIKGIEWCSNQGADIISISLGGGRFYGTCDGEADAQAINNAFIAGSFVAASTGNDGWTDSMSAPACASNATAVGAVYDNDTVTDYSNGGPELDLVAPGGDFDYDATPPYPEIISCFSPNVNSDSGLCFLLDDHTCYDDHYKVDDSWIRCSGTSQATPHVSGVAALMLEADPTLEPLEIKSILEDTADDLGVTGWDDRYGWGRVNALGAINNVTGAKYISMTLLGYPVDFGNFDPGNSNIPAPGNPYTIRIDPETNVNVDVYQKGDDYTSGDNVLGIGNMTWYNSDDVGSSVSVAKDYFVVDTGVTPDTNIPMYYWIDIPSAHMAGDYNTTLYVKAVETGSSP